MHLLSPTKSECDVGLFNSDDYLYGIISKFTTSHLCRSFKEVMPDQIHHSARSKSIHSSCRGGTCREVQKFIIKDACVSNDRIHTKVFDWKSTLSSS